jgi:hypothetical protein
MIKDYLQFTGSPMYRIRNLTKINTVKNKMDSALANLIALKVGVICTGVELNTF